MIDFGSLSRLLGMPFEQVVCNFAAACLREKAMLTFPVAPADVECFSNWDTPDDLAAVGGNPCPKSRPGRARSVAVKP